MRHFEMINVFSWSKSPENFYIFSHFLIYILTYVYIIVIFIIFKICLPLHFLQFGAVSSISSRMMDILSLQNTLDMSDICSYCISSTIVSYSFICSWNYPFPLYWIFLKVDTMNGLLLRFFTEPRNLQLNDG